ncbi:hypothetical protein ACVZD4_03865 [Escherichia coli]
MTGGVTIYYDPETGDSMTFDSSNRIDRRSQRGAGDPYTGEVVGCETNESGISAAYGTTKIYTTDTRARWLHGGDHRCAILMLLDKAGNQLWDVPVHRMKM